MQKKTKQTPSFISMEASGSSQQSSLQENVASLTSLLFTLHSIETIDVNNWVKCYCDNDLRPLIISGTPTPHDLQQCFQEILIDYHDKIGSVESLTMVSMRKKITRTRGKLIIVPLLLHNYILTRKKELKDMMGKYFFRFDSTWSDERLHTHLQAHIKNWDVELQMFEKDLDRYIESKKTTDKVTRETFLKNIVQMRKEGFDVTMTTMLDEYAITVQLFNQFIANKEKETERGKY